MLDLLNLAAGLQAFLSQTVAANELAALKVLAVYLMLDAAATMLLPAARGHEKFSLDKAVDTAKKFLGPFLALCLLAAASRLVDQSIFGAAFAGLYALYAAKEGRDALLKVRRLIGLVDDQQAGLIVAPDQP